MGTKHIVPRAEGQGGIGTATLGWGELFITNTTNDSATQGGKLTLTSNDGAAMQIGSRLGVIEFKGAESSSALTIGARIEAICDAAWTATENGASLKFFTTDANASESLVLTLDSDKLATFAGSVAISADVSAVNATLTGYLRGPASFVIDPATHGNDTGTVVIAGNLQVDGTTTTVNSTIVTIDDPVFTLGGDTPPASETTKDKGIEFRYHTGSAAKIGFFGWDDDASSFTFIADATNNSEVFSGSAGNAIFGNITGTLQTVAQTNITSVGALNGGTITSGFGAINNGASAITTTGLISGGSLDIDNVLINGTTIGHTDDTDLITLADGVLTVAGSQRVNGISQVGSNGVGYDFVAYGATSGKKLNWDSLEDELIIDGDLDVNGDSSFSGNVGIGKSPSTFRLDLETTSGGNGLKITRGTADFQVFQAANGASYVGTGNADTLHLITGGSSKMSISSTGNVSVGAATVGHLGVRGLTNDSSAFSFEAANSSGNSILLVRNDGKVGIGTTTMHQDLNLLSSSTSQALINIGTSNSSRFLNIGVASSAGYIMMENAASLNIGTGGVTRLSIASDGDVGIGTTSPSSKLHIVSSGGTDGLRVNAGTSSSNNAFVINNEADNATLFYIRGNGDTSIGGKLDVTTSVSGFASTITNNKDDSQGVLIRTSDNDGGEYILDLQSSSSSTGTDYASKFRVAKGGNIAIPRAYNDTNNAVIYIDSTISSGASTYQGSLLLQAGGAGSASYGSGLRLYGHAHASSPGSVEVGLSAVSGAKFTVDSYGAGGGTDIFTVERSGTVLIGTTTVTSVAKLQLTSSNAFYGFVDRAQVSNVGHPAGFFNSAGTVVGSISTNNTSTTYATTSDYRLKENVTPITNALSRLNKLKPSRFNFIAHADKIVDGFIAHEVAEIIPEAIHGKKDALNEDGAPDYQGIDQSKIVPLLTAAIQEQQTIIEDLKSRIETLER